MKRNKLSLTTLLLVTASLAPNSFSEIYELRTYTSHEGKLENVLNRFENHTMALFEKHGIRNIGYWVSEDQDNTLIYIVAHESRDRAKHSWENFVSDPKWKAARNASVADGPIVNKIENLYMKKASFSP